LIPLMTKQLTDSLPIEYGLSLGSNLESRLKNLAMARDLLASNPQMEILDCAPVYQTEPVNVLPEHQSKYYLNTVIIVLANLTPEGMRDVICGIEFEGGRARTDDQNAPRPIDIDIVYAGTISFKSDSLCIPHARWAARRFVVQPLADVRPGLLVPGESRTMQEILEALPRKPEVALHMEKW